MRVLAAILAFSLCLAARAATNTPASLNLADVQETVYASAAGDTVSLPAGSKTWTNSLFITNAISLIGAGTNSTYIGNAIGSVNSALIQVRLKVDTGLRISGISFIGTTNTPGQGIGVYNDSSNGYLFPRNIRVDNCYFYNMRSRAFDWHAFGVIDHCIFEDGGTILWAKGQSPHDAYTSGQWNWDTFSPIPWNSTNYVVIEDCAGVITADWTGSMGGPWFASEEGASYIVRRCTLDIWHDSTADVYPFDIHGNTPDVTYRSTVCAQFYQNTITYHASTFAAMTWDFRGGSGLIYSNTISGGYQNYVKLREEDAYLWTTNAITDCITNLYVWQNFNDGTPVLPQVMANESTNYIKLGEQYFTNAPPDFAQLTYPHPMVTAQDGEQPPATTPGGIYLNRATIQGGGLFKTQ